MKDEHILVQVIEEEVDDKNLSHSVVALKLEHFQIDSLQMIKTILIHC